MHRRSFVKMLLLGSALPALPSIVMAKSSGSEIKNIASGGIDASLDYLNKMRNPDQFHAHDIVSEQVMVKNLARRLEKVQNFVGYRNFTVLSFDSMLRYGRHYSQIGSFDSKETDFLEKIFYEDAMRYGFYGEKPLTSITETIEQRSLVKIPHTGQYLFKGEPLELYTRIKRDIGDTITLTSGVRSVVKQMHLFLRKASKYEGNLSLASRSLAPPGYSFHGVGDFDVGHIKLGAQNFTEAFARTDEFKKLRDLGYIDIRYTMDNRLGVRFEPWHIKVA